MKNPTAQDILDFTEEDLKEIKKEQKNRNRKAFIQKTSKGVRRFMNSPINIKGKVTKKTGGRAKPKNAIKFLTSGSTLRN